MRFASALVVLALVLGSAVLVSQTAPSPVAPTDYTLNERIGAVALYPGVEYRPFIEAKFLVSSVQDLESQINQIPFGTTLHWLPHNWDDTGNPILFGSVQYKQFVRFCNDHGIRILIDRAYAHHLSADGSYARTVVVRGDKGKTPIEFRSTKVHPGPDAGSTNDYILRMLYDPKSKLFYWQDYGLYPGYGPEGGANLSDQWLGSSVIFVSADQMTIFGLAVGSDASLGIVVSTKRENSLDQGKATASHALERKAATPFRSKRVIYAKQLPPHFFEQCITDIDMPGIASVEHQKKRWQVTVAAQNGNLAILSLDNSYNLISIKTTLNPHADSVGGCKR